MLYLAAGGWAMSDSLWRCLCACVRACVLVAAGPLLHWGPPPAGAAGLHHLPAWHQVSGGRRQRTNPPAEEVWRRLQDLTETLGLHTGKVYQTTTAVLFLRLQLYRKKVYFLSIFEVQCFSASCTHMFVMGPFQSSRVSQKQILDSSNHFRCATFCLFFTTSSLALQPEALSASPQHTLSLRHRHPGAPRANKVFPGLLKFSHRKLQI